MRRPGLLLQRNAALGERERLFGPVLHQRDVGLVAADGAEHVAGLDHERQPLSLPQRRHRFVQASFLRQHDAGKRVHHRQVPAVASRMKRGRSAGNVLAHDGGVADLAVADPKLVVGEPDRPGVVRALGELQRAGEKRNTPRGFAAGDGDAAVHAPEIGETGGIQALASFGRRP